MYIVSLCYVPMNRIFQHEHRHNDFRKLMKNSKTQKSSVELNREHIQNSE